MKIQSANRAVLISTALLASLLGAGCASMHQAMNETGMSSAMGAPAGNSLSVSDQQFARVAAGSGLYEIAAAQLALAQGSDPRVRSYAQMLIEHHTMANQELMGILSARGLVMTPDLPPDKRDKIAVFRARSGPQFDALFIEVAGRQDHLATIGLFEQASTTLSDPALRAWALKTLPILRAHYTAAQQIEVGPAG